MVNDQLRPAVLCGEFSVDVTNDGDGRAVVDTVVRAEAMHVVNRQREHCAVIFEDTCIGLSTLSFDLNAVDAQIVQ